MHKNFLPIKKIFTFTLMAIYMIFLLTGCVSYKDYDIVISQEQSGKYVEIYRAHFTPDLLYKENVENPISDPLRPKIKIGINVVEIQNGVARITNANCPTKRCTHFTLKYNRAPWDSLDIVCLPNGLKIDLEKHVESSNGE
jgi:hypothetical protein